jgi:transcriptional regulator with XRE-family HTH domain
MMATRSTPAERARRRADEDDRRARLEIGRARRGAGLSHDAVGAACGISGSAEWRIERGITKTIDIRTLACIGPAVGLDVRLQVYPAGDPVRDAGQVRLLERLRQRLHPDLDWRTEVPLPIERDLRAWDALIRGSDWVVAVEAETVLDDLQAIERRIALKQRDGRIDHVIVLIGDTRRNRRLLEATPGAFPAFRRDARTTLRELGAARDPGCSAIVVL